MQNPAPCGSVALRGHAPNGAPFHVPSAQVPTNLSASPAHAKGRTTWHTPERGRKVAARAAAVTCAHPDRELPRAPWLSPDRTLPGKPGCSQRKMLPPPRPSALLALLLLVSATSLPRVAVADAPDPAISSFCQVRRAGWEAAGREAAGGRCAD